MRLDHHRCGLKKRRRRGCRRTAKRPSFILRSRDRIEPSLATQAKRQPTFADVAGRRVEPRLSSLPQFEAAYGPMRNRLLDHLVRASEQRNREREDCSARATVGTSLERCATTWQARAPLPSSAYCSVFRSGRRTLVSSASIFRSEHREDDGHQNEFTAAIC